MRTHLLLLKGIFVLSFAGPCAVAQTLDPSFTAANIYAPGTVLTMVEQPDGKHVVAGTFNRIDGSQVANLSRFNPNGSLDATFQQNVGTTMSAYRMRILSNGQLLLLSSRSVITGGGLTRHSLLRLNADGTGDPAFNPGTGASLSGSDTYVDDMLPLPNGQTIVVGPFDRFNGTLARRIVRLTATGDVDPTFNTGMGASNEIESIVGLPNGQLLIGGYFSSYNGSVCNGIARLNADGSFDSTFSAGLGAGSDVVNVVLQPDGKVLLAGALLIGGAGNGQGLARLLPMGANDPSFSPPAVLTDYTTYSYSGNALQLQADGKILFINNLDFGSTGVRRVARLNADGTMDASFQVGTGPNAFPSSVTLLANGKLLVGGSFTNCSGTVDRPLVQLTNTGAIDASFQPVIQTSGSISVLARQADGKLLAGGNFSQIDALPLRRLARFNADGTLDASFATSNSPDDTPVDLALQPDGQVVAATPTTVRRYASTGAADNTFASPDFSSHRLSRLLLQPDGRLVVGGNFFPNNLFASPTIVRLLPDGSPDGSFAPARTGPGRFTYFDTMEQQPDGKLLVAGSFLPPTGSTIRTVRRLESTGALDASFAGRAFMVASASNNFLSLAVQTDGKVLVAGRFSAYDGAPRTNVARLNSDGTNDAAFLPPSITGTVSELLLQPNGRVLVGGLFTGTGLPDNLARLLPNGQADASFGATAVPDSTVSALLVQPDGKIVLGGAFTTVGNQPAVAVARLTVANVLLATLPQAVADRTTVWPVPTHSSLNVALDGTAHPQALDLLDVLGRPVVHQNLAGRTTTTLPVEQLAPGTYVLRVTYDAGAVVRRIQVQ